MIGSIRCPAGFLARAEATRDRMFEDYSDITERIAETPKWWDENGVSKDSTIGGQVPKSRFIGNWHFDHPAAEFQQKQLGSSAWP